MENYSKGKNVEEPIDRNNIPIPNLPDDFLWMQVSGGSKICIGGISETQICSLDFKLAKLEVSGGSKIQQLLKYALAEFPKHKSVVWTGSGAAAGKAVSCAEIMKKKNRNSLYQITKICFRTVDEYWDPLVENLDQIVVKRKLPVIHILLSMNPLNENELGYQAPGSTITKEFQALNMKPAKVSEESR